MRTFLVVLNRRTELSTTYVIAKGERLCGDDARERCKWFARQLGVKEANVTHTPKVLKGIRIYLAVK